MKNLVKILFLSLVATITYSCGNNKNVNNTDKQDSIKIENTVSNDSTLNSNDSLSTDTITLDSTLMVE